MSREYFVAGSQVNETTNSQFLADSLFQLDAAAGTNATGSGSIDTVSLTAIASAVTAIVSSSIDAISLTALTATVSFDNTSSGSVDAISLTAVSGTASFSNSSSGSVDTVSLTAPDAATSTGDTGVGSIDAVDLLAPNGITSFDNSSTGSIDTLSLSAPTATTIGDITASGSIDEIILGEQDGTASFTSEASASIDAASLTAPDAIGSSGDNGVGSIDLIDLTAIAATTSYSSSVSGSIDAITLSAPTGAGGTNVDATGTGSIDNISLTPIAGNYSELIVTFFSTTTIGTGNVVLDGCALNDNVAFVITTDSKCYVLDTSDKNAISIITIITTATNPQDICTDGSFLYIPCFGSNGSGILAVLQKWDISTLSAPTLSNSVALGGTSRSVTESGDYVYVGKSATSSFLIFDKATLTLQSTTSCGANPLSPVVIGDTLYLSCNSATTSFQIWDVTNKSSPSLLGSTTYAAAVYNDIFINGSYAYTANTTHDLIVIDITNSASPSVIFQNSSANNQYYGSFVLNDAYFASIDSSGIFYWYSVTNPLAPTFLGSMSTTSPTITRMFRFGSYFYILSDVSATNKNVTPLFFDIVDIINATATTDIDSIQLLPASSDIAESTLDSISVGDLHATALTDAGVGIVSIDNISLGELTAVASQIFDISPTVISQYANSPIILALVTDMMIYLNSQHQRNEFIRNIWDVRTANSQGLDIWGRIVGISRYLTLTNQDYFGFDPDFDPFNNSPFFAGNNVTNTFILGDEDYRRVILAKASANITNCTIPGIENTLSLLFSGSGATWVDVTGDHELTYVFNFTPTELELAIINAPKLIPRPAGFTIIYDYLT